MNASAEWLLLMIGQIRNEIDCRIEHGADSNGHLEAIRDMIDKSSYFIISLLKCLLTVCLSNSKS